MITDHALLKDSPAVTIEVQHVRALAGQLLLQLRVERARSERRLADSGRRDPLKLVTGHSALDDAIHATEIMIRNIDELDLVGS